MPVTLQEPREIVFGLMATPGKPMRDNWRNIFFRNNPKNSRFIHWMAAQYWGSPSVMYSKLPIDQDTSVLSKLQEARMGGGGTDKFMRAWSNEHLQGDISHKSGKSKEKIENLLNHAFGISRRAGDFLTVYWEEFHATTLFHPERQNGVFWEEWMESTHSYPQSYLNFAAWCGAEFIRRGMGLYIDNSFPKPTYDTFTTSAYKRPNGDVQPSANMWRHRQYFRRIWVLHQQLAPGATKPIMMVYEIRTKFGDDGRTLLKKLADFAYTQPDAEVYNDWDTGAPLKTNDSQCKWLLVEHHGELMVLLCTWNAEKEKVEVTLDTDAVDAQPEKAEDIEREKSQKLKDGSFSFTMPGHGVRMFRLY